MVKSSRVALKLVIVGTAVAAAAWLILTEPFILPQQAADTDYVMHVAAPQRCVGVFVVCMSLWFTNLIPLAATGLLAIALLPLLGILPEQRAFGLFGNEAVFFMLGVFLLVAAVLTVTGHLTDNLAWRRAAPALGGMLFAGGFLYLAQRSRLWRHYLLATASASVGLLMTWPLVAEPYGNLRVWALLMALLSLAMGAYVLRRFVREHPIVEERMPDVG